MGVPIIKKNDQPSSLNHYFQKVKNFHGDMNLYANSIEIILDGILEKIGIKPPKLFGRKIDKFERNKLNLNKYTANFDELLEKLKRFNEDWNISKHGMCSAKENIKDITLYKDGVFHVFDEKKIEQINQEFTQIQKALIEIHESIV